MIKRNLNAYVGSKIARIAGNNTEIEIILSSGKKYTFLGKNGCELKCPDFDYAQGVLKKHKRITSASLVNKATLENDSLLYETILSIEVEYDKLTYHWKLNSTEFMTSVVDYIVE